MRECKFWSSNKSMVAVKLSLVAFFVVALALSISSFLPASADVGILTHTSTITVTPNIVAGGSNVDFTVNVENDAGSLDGIHEFRIYEQNEFTNLDCDSASDWNGPYYATNQYGDFCFWTAQEGYEIDPTENKDFTFSADTPETECCRSWLMETRDVNEQWQFVYNDICIDSTPPETTKDFIGPYKIDEFDVEWIDGVTLVELTATDDIGPHDAGVAETWYVNIWAEQFVEQFQLGCNPEEPCWDPGYCQFFLEYADEIPEEWWQLYVEPFPKKGESCHVLFYYSIDEVGNVEDIQVNCFFVDTTPPEMSKEIGDPNIPCNNCEGTPEPDSCDYYSEEQCSAIPGCDWVGGCAGYDVCEGMPEPESCMLYTFEQCEMIPGCFWDINPFDMCHGTPQVPCMDIEAMWPGKCIETLGCEWVHYEDCQEWCEGTPDSCEAVAENWPQDPELKCDETPGCAWEYDCDYWVRDHVTPITLDCMDPEPHPSDDEEVCYKVSYDLEPFDLTDYYCDEPLEEITQEGHEGDWCCVPAPEIIIFEEDSLHDLEWFCRDAVDKKSEIDLEWFRVDSLPPIITKTMIGDDHLGTCPPLDTGDDCYVKDDGNNGVRIDVKDDDTYDCAVDDVYCEYYLWWKTTDKDTCDQVGYEWDDPWCLIDDGEFSDYAEVIFYVDSTHKLIVNCEDKLGNKMVEDVEYFLVDSTPPETTKEYGQPYKLFEGVEWVSSQTPIYLYWYDEKVGTAEVWYKNVVVPDEACWDPYMCEMWYYDTPNGEWKLYWQDGDPEPEPIYKEEESCHLFKYYSIDKLGNEEKIHYQCFFVDNKPPIGIKKVGEPRIPCAVATGGPGEGGVQPLALSNLDPSIRQGDVYTGQSVSIMSPDGPCDGITQGAGQCAYVAADAVPQFVEDTMLAQGAEADPECGNILILSSGDPLDGDNVLSTNMGNPGCGLNPDGYNTNDCVILPGFTTEADSIVLAISSEWPEWLGSVFTDWMQIGGIVDISIEDWVGDPTLVELPYGPSTSGTVTLATLASSKSVDLKVADSGDYIYDTVLIVVPVECFEEPEPPILCGNCVIDPGEECDDGNNENGDGCSSICLLEEDGEPQECVPGCWWVRDHVTPITLDCMDPEPHPVDQETLCYRISFDDPQIPWLTKEYCDEFGGIMEEDWCCVSYEFLPYTLYFTEDSEHDLEFYCRDHLENKGKTDIEWFKVDSTPPETTKCITPDPYVDKDGREYIDTAHEIELTAEDGGEICAVGVKETWYLNTIVDNKYCEDPKTYCIPENGGDWQLYEGPFQKEKESCHMLEYYSIDDLGNTEKIKAQCFFVDKTPPETQKWYEGPQYPDIELCEKWDCLTDLEKDFFVTGRYGDNNPTAGAWELAIWEVDGGENVVAQDNYGWTSGVEVDFSLSYDPSDGSIVYTVDGKTLNWGYDADKAFEYIIPFAKGNKDGNSVELTEMYLNGKPLPDLSSNGDPYYWGLKIPLSDLEQVYGFTITGKAKLTWSGVNTKDEQPAFHIFAMNTHDYCTLESPKWITSETEVHLSAIDPEPHPSGVKATYYKDTYLPNPEDWHYCYEDCKEWIPNDYEDEGWQLYEGPFYKEPESCHIIEYYSVDNVGKKEPIHWQCVLVDNSAPEPEKTVGKPRTEWDGEDANFYDIAHLCWSTPNPEDCKDDPDCIECWKVTLFTPITLDCIDPEPHPVDEEETCFKVEVDGDDETEDYCDGIDGAVYDKYGDGFCCGMDAPYEFYFDEETEHNLKYYCVDALENIGDEDEEKFKVEGTSFEIQINKKWNLISVPFVMLDDSIDEVFEDIAEDIESVLTYDAETDEWYIWSPVGPNSLTEMVPGWGYWVKALNANNLTIGGSLFSPAKTPPDKEVVHGWNLIGYYGTDEQDGYYGPYGNGKEAYCALYSLVDTTVGHPRWSSLVTYWEPWNPDQWKYLGTEDNMDPGAGYWLEMDVDDTYRFSTICWD